MIKCFLIENSFLLQNLYYYNSNICKTGKSKHSGPCYEIDLSLQ